MLSQAVIHVQATKKVAQLALKLKQLKAFVHVSTGYVNSNLPRGSHIEEQVYPPLLCQRRQAGARQAGHAAGRHGAQEG